MRGRWVEEICRRNELRPRRGVDGQPEARLVQVRRCEVALGRDRLVGEQVAEHGQHTAAVGGVGQILLEQLT